MTDDLAHLLGEEAERFRIAAAHAAITATTSPTRPAPTWTRSPPLVRTRTARPAHAAETTALQAHALGAHVGAPARASAPVCEPTRLELAVLCTQAKQALTSLGWKPAIAAAAVTTAQVLPNAELSLERLIRAALRQRPKPCA